MHVLSILPLSAIDRSLLSILVRDSLFDLFSTLSVRVLFDYSALSNLDAKGNDADLGIYKGNVLLIVNVASQCCSIHGHEDIFREINTCCESESSLCQKSPQYF